MSAFDKIRDCPVLATVAVVGGKWKPRILWHLRAGPARFGELQRAIGSSEKVLADNLRALERDGVIARAEVMAGKVLTAEYSYSDYGRLLVPVLDVMGEWGARHRDRPGSRRTAP